MPGISPEVSQLLSQNIVRQPFVSVIIPVYNDAERLRLCLEALEKQSYPHDHYQVIVVDNGSDPDQDVGDVVQSFEVTVLTQELIPGSYAARNKGLSLAKGDIIAFTDSDCIPALDWLENGVKYLIEHPDCGMLGGRIDVFTEIPGAPTLVELYDQVVMGFPQEYLLKTFNVAMTANVLTRRAVIEQVGGFSPALRSFGDGEWSQRVYQAGYKQCYADDVYIGHPARNTFAALAHRITRYSGGRFDHFITQEPIWWKRHRRFVRFIVEDLTTYLFQQSGKVFQDERVDTIGKKIQLLGLVILMHLLSALEIVRLRCGGQSRR